MEEANYYTKKIVAESTQFTIVSVRNPGTYQQEYGFLDESGCLVALPNKTVPFVAINGYEQASKLIKSLRKGASYNALPAQKMYNDSYAVEQASNYVEDGVTAELKARLKALHENMRSRGQHTGQTYDM